MQHRIRAPRFVRGTFIPMIMILSSLIPEVAYVVDIVTMLILVL